MSTAGIMSGWLEAVEAGELRFPKCEYCGRWNWYPLPRCRSCGSPPLRWVGVEPCGTIYSWTRVHRAFARDAELQVPYVTGIIEISDAPGVRLTCLQDPPGPGPAIGDRVVLSLQAGPSGTRWTFAPGR